MNIDLLALLAELVNERIGDVELLGRWGGVVNNGDIELLDAVLSISLYGALVLVTGVHNTTNTWVGSETCIRSRGWRGHIGEAGKSRRAANPFDEAWAHQSRKEEHRGKLKRVRQRS